MATVGVKGLTHFFHVRRVFIFRRWRLVCYFWSNVKCSLCIERPLLH